MMASFLYLLLICFIFVMMTKAARKDKQSNKSKAQDEDVVTKGKLSAETIASLSKSMSLIPLSDKNFTKFVTDKPRYYHAVVVFTATNPKYQCDVCVQQRQSYMDLAELYQAEYDFNTTEEANRIAFFILEVDSARQTFGELNLETVPRLFLLPSLSFNDPKVIMSNFEKSNQIFMSGSQRMLDEIAEATKVKIHLTTKPGSFLVILVVIAIAMAYFISHAAQDVSKAIFWYQNRTLWTLASLVCFSVGVSGSIFCIIRSAPLYGYGRTGPMIFAGAGRDQFLIEGIIIAALTIGSALAMTLAYYLTKIPFPILRHVGVILTMSIFIMFSLQVFDHYVEKTKWYRIQDTVPPEAWSFLTSSVKKTSYLPKRLLRVSEIWLFEYKDWQGFTKKVKQLIFDYIIRILGVEKFFTKVTE